MCYNKNMQDNQKSQGGIKMERITYYGIAKTPSGKIGQVFVERRDGKAFSQHFTGKIYRTIEDADADVEKLNVAIAESRKKEGKTTAEERRNLRAAEQEAHKAKKKMPLTEAEMRKIGAEYHTKRSI